MQAHFHHSLIHGTPFITSPSTTQFCCSNTRSTPLRRKPASKSRRSLPSHDDLNLKSLTSRVVQLTRRRQLAQIFEEIEVAMRRHGKLNVIVMNAVMQACVHCRDLESAFKLFDEMSKPEGCGVDDITYGILLKGLGDAQRIDEAFQVLESVEKGTAYGSPRLSAALICSLLNALIESGDLRRANGLLARYGYVLQEGGTPSILTFNLLMKGYVRTGCHQVAIGVHDEILKHNLKPDMLSYNTLILACIKNGNLEKAMQFFEQMKAKHGLGVFPDIVTYTTLLQAFGKAKDIRAVTNILMQMKSCKIRIDRIAYTVAIDALLNCGSIKGALSVMGEMMKQSNNPRLKPKPHLFLSMMRTFAAMGDYNMVSKFRERIWFDSAGTITHEMQAEADKLLIEAALNQGQVELAVQKLRQVIIKWKYVPWSDREVTVALRLEALMGLSRSILSPRVLPQVSLRDSIDRFMTPFDEASPLSAKLKLKQVVMRLFKDYAVPIVDEWGGCVGILHRKDCDKLDAALGELMRSPPPSVASSTSVGCVIDLMLEKRYEMIVIVEYEDDDLDHLNGRVMSSAAVSTSLKAVGVFSYKELRLHTENL